VLTARRLLAPASVAALVATAAAATMLVRGVNGTVGPNLVLLVVAYAALAALVSFELRRHRAGIPSGLPKSVVVGFSAGLMALAFTVQHTESHNVWAYSWYGRVVAHYHASPYSHPPAKSPHDRFARRVDPIWQRDGSVYGPVFTVTSGAGMLVFGWSFLTARLFFQLVAALCVVGAMVLVWRRTRSPTAIACLGLNPLVVLSVVNGGHNDAWVGLAVLGGVLLVMNGRWKWAGLAFAAALLVKVAAALPLAAVGLWLWRRHGWRPAFTTGAWAVGAAIVAYAMVGGTAAFAPLHTAQLHFSGASVWYGPRRWLTLAQVRNGLSGGAAGHLVRQAVSAGASAAVIAMTLLLVARRLNHSDPALVAGASVIAYTLLGAYVLPWYVFWALPALLIAWRSRLTWLAMVHGAVLHLAYLPDPHLHLHPGRIDQLRIFTPIQRLQLDIYQVWVPLVELAIIAVVLVMSLPRPRRVPSVDVFTRMASGNVHRTG